MGKKQTAKQESLTLTDSIEETPSSSSTTLPPPKSRVGNLLKRYREDKNISLKQVSQELCIRQAFLKAIEEGIKHNLPERVYTVGFIRSYAHFLGLDEEAILKEYRKEISQDFEITPHMLPASVPQKSLPSFLNYIIGILLIVGALMVWLSFKESFSPAPVSPPSSSQKDFLPSPSYPLPSSSSSIENNFSQTSEDPKKELEVPEEDT